MFDVTWNSISLSFPFRQALHWAAAMGRANCVDLLLKLGADPSMHDLDAKNALHYAKQASHEGIITVSVVLISPVRNSVHVISKHICTPYLFHAVNSHFCQNYGIVSSWCRVRQLHQLITSIIYNPSTMRWIYLIVIYNNVTFWEMYWLNQRCKL